MLFGRAVFTEAFYKFPGHFINIIIIRRLNFKIKICAVKVTYGSITPDNPAAILEKVLEISGLVFSQKIQCPVYMLVPNFRLFIITAQMAERGKLGFWFQYPCAG